MDPLALSTQWKVLGSEADPCTSNKVATRANYQNGFVNKIEDLVATVKIFSDANEYNKYQVSCWMRPIITDVSDMF